MWQRKENLGLVFSWPAKVIALNHYFFEKLKEIMEDNEC